MKRNSFIIGALFLSLVLSACSSDSDLDVDLDFSNDEILNNGGELTPESTCILETWDFEGDSPLHNLFDALDEKIRIVSDPLNASNKVMSVELPSGCDRAEVSWKDGNISYYFYANKNSDLKHGDEFWIGFKVYIPSSTYTQNNSPSILQLGPISRSVNFNGSYGLYQLMTPTHYGYFRWRKFTSAEYSPIGNYTEDPCVRRNGVWEKFVIHCRLRNDDTGLVELWKNGDLVYRKAERNAELGTRIVIKWGLYIGVGNSSNDKLACYYDDIKIGNSQAVYSDVAPN